MKQLGIFVRGLAMGAADIVPGVSGGTIAFISGIYPRLLNAIKSFDVAAIRLLFRGELSKLWIKIDGFFLLALTAGILTSIFSLAHVFTWLLQYYPEPLWGFFFGLILASAFVLSAQVGRWRSVEYLCLFVGIAVAVYVALASRGGFLEGYPGAFLAGFIAICAMILPGISGSFILLLLGMYSVVLTAISELNIPFIVVFAMGAILGLMVFSRILSWLLSQFASQTVALLTGFLFGSLTTIWPWKRTLDWVVGSDGELKPAQQWPVSPLDYLILTGNEPMLLHCLSLAFVGAAVVWLIDRKWGQMQLELD